MLGAVRAARRSYRCVTGRCALRRMASATTCLSACAAGASRCCGPAVSSSALDGMQLETARNRSKPKDRSPRNGAQLDRLALHPVRGLEQSSCAALAVQKSRP
eukprot:131660-Chlamydomonas_euryale.AAC.1